MVEDYERALIEAALASAGGHQRRAAALLKILPSTLCEKMKRLGMRRRRPDAP
jgi:DNA-binding NtrC family response regulator